jgi:hypothetical protein
MSLYILRENFMDRLRVSVRDNGQRYHQNKPWLNEFANGASWFIKPNLEPADKLELLNPVGDDLKDLENSIRLHKALAFLTPLQARDPRLWTRLAHEEFWLYMRKRWDVERYGSDPGKVERFIISRYFVAQNQSRALLRNGIARLWWYSKITFDPDRQNPYELTGVLLDQLDITQQILERNLGRAPQIASGFLEFLLRHRKELLGSGDGKRSQIRHLAKHLNLYGGTTLLDCLDRTDIISILEDEYALITAKPEFVDAG